MPKQEDLKNEGLWCVGSRMDINGKVILDENFVLDKKFC